MTRQDLLRALIRQAKENGFTFRRWYYNAMRLPWTSFDAAIDVLASERRYYALLFSHEFARSFWQSGSQISFIVPNSSYTRRSHRGDMITVTRKPFIRRTLKPDAWRYHLREMAVAEDPLRYIRRFLLIAEDLEINHVSDSAGQAPHDNHNHAHIPLPAPDKMADRMADKASDRVADKTPHKPVENLSDPAVVSRKPPPLRPSR